MTRHIPILLLCLLFSASESAGDRLKFLIILGVDWGGGVKSSGEIKISGLPGIARAKERPRQVRIQIRKRIDKASPMLRRAQATGRPLPRVMLKARNSSGAHLTYELKRVYIKSYVVNGSGAKAEEFVSALVTEVGFPA